MRVFDNALASFAQFMADGDLFPGWNAYAREWFTRYKVVNEARDGEQLAAIIGEWADKISDGIWALDDAQGAQVREAYETRDELRAVMLALAMEAHNQLARATARGITRH